MLEQLQQRLSIHEPASLQIDLPEAAVLIAITEDSDNPEVILTRRAQHLNVHRGEVAFPGGKWEQHDSTLWHTALRESAEEIGLDSSLVAPLGQLRPVVSRFGIKVTPYVGTVPTNVMLTPNEQELDAIFRVPLEFFCQDQRLRTDTISFQGRNYYVPCYQYDEYKIWGLTAIMLVELLNVAFDQGIALDVPQLSEQLK